MRRGGRAQNICDLSSTFRSTQIINFGVYWGDTRFRCLGEIEARPKIELCPYEGVFTKLKGKCGFWGAARLWARCRCVRRGGRAQKRCDLSSTFRCTQIINLGVWRGDTRFKCLGKIGARPKIELCPLFRFKKGQCSMVRFFNTPPKTACSGQKFIKCGGGGWS